MEQFIKSNKTIGKNIKLARKKNKMTQDQLCAKMQLFECDISRGTLAKIEAGIRHISLDELRVISKILNVDYNYLLNY